MSDNAMHARRLTLQVIIEKLNALKPVLESFEEYQGALDRRKEREANIADRYPAGRHIPHNDDDVILLKHNMEAEAEAKGYYEQERTQWELSSLRRNAAHETLGRERAASKYQHKKDHSIPNPRDKPNPKAVRQIMAKPFATKNRLEPSHCGGFIHCTVCHKHTGQPISNQVEVHCKGLKHQQVLSDLERHEQLIKQNEDTLTAGPVIDGLAPYHTVSDHPRVHSQVLYCQ